MKGYKLSGVIVNTNYELVGAIMKDGNGAQVADSVQNLINRKLLNSREKLLGLGVWVQTADGKITKTKTNMIRLTARILDNDGPDAKVIGYYADVCGTEYPVPTAHLIRISGWITPENFVVRTTVSDNGRPMRFLAGKPGYCRLGELPAYVGANSRGTKADEKKGTVPTSEAKAPAKKVGAAVGGGSIVKLDIETLVRTVGELGGLVAMAPGAKYQSLGGSSGKAIRFKEVSNTEVAFPKLEYNEKKMNANLKFRRRGQVFLPEGGPINVVDAIMWRERHLFYNGRNQMDTIRVLIPAEGAGKFEQLGSKDFAVRRVAGNEESVKERKASYAGDPYNTENMVEFEVRLNKLSIIGFPHPGNESILDTAGLYRAVYMLEYGKTIKKILNTKKKALEGADPSLKSGGGRKICPMYANLSTEQLSYISQCGINIFDGSYNPSKDDLEESESGASKGGAPAVEIEYRLSGFGEKDISGNGKYGVSSEEVNAVRGYLEKAIEEIEGEGMSLADQYEATLRHLKYIDSVLKDTKHTLWLHKCAMLTKMGGKIHQHDAECWNKKPSRKAGAVIYECNAPEFKGLAMTVVGTAI